MQCRTMIDYEALIRDIDGRYKVLPFLSIGNLLLERYWFIRIKVERDATRAKSFTTKVTKSTKKFKKTRNSFVLVYLRELRVLRG